MPLLREAEYFRGGLVSVSEYYARHVERKISFERFLPIFLGKFVQVLVFRVAENLYTVIRKQFYVSCKRQPGSVKVFLVYNPSGQYLAVRYFLQLESVPAFLVEELNGNPVFLYFFDVF